MMMTCGRCGWQGEEARYCARCGADLAAPPGASRVTFPPPPLRPPEPGPAPYVRSVLTTTRPAGFWIRVVAVLIDGVVLIVAQGILFGAGWILWGEGLGAGTAVRGATKLFSSLIGAGYTIVFHWMWGQTLGKMALQIRVVSMGGGPLSFGQAVGRYFASFLSALILGIGFIMAGVRSDKRALHDLLAGTRVEYL